MRPFLLLFNCIVEAFGFLMFCFADESEESEKSPCYEDKDDDSDST